MFTLQLFFFNSIYVTFLFLGIPFFSYSLERGDLLAEHLGTAQTPFPPPWRSHANPELYFCPSDRLVFPAQRECIEIWYWGCAALPAALGGKSCCIACGCVTPPGASPYCPCW